MSPSKAKPKAKAKPTAKSTAKPTKPKAKKPRPGPTFAKLSAQAIAKKASAQPKTQKSLSKAHVAFVLDCSGSMEAIWPDVTREMRRNLNVVRDESIRTYQQTDLSLVTFGSNFKVPIENQPITSNMLPALRPNMGGTALYRAVMEAIMVLERNPDCDQTASNLVLVFTDGEDNESRLFHANYAKLLRERIGQLQKTDRWSFAFVVPPGGRSTITDPASGLGLPSGNVIEWEQTSAGTKNVSRNIQAGISHYYSTLAAGTRSTRGFFTPDLSKVSPTTVATKLVDIRRKVKVFDVPREEAIREFVEQRLGSYILGTAFYELTKDEKIASEKELLVMEIGKKAVYAGVQARRLLGLPATDVQVRPGQMGAFKIFVSSNSVNRKLVRGTKLIVMR